MPIEPTFQKNRTKAGTEDGVTIWGPVDPPQTLGIRGTYVAVDWDLCTGCGICLEVCSRRVYGWIETSNHPTSEKKTVPTRELDCVQCYKCETQCPVQAIRVVFPGPTGRLACLAANLMLVQPIAGIGYGVWFGPLLGLQSLFYAGWVLLPVALLFFISIAIYFKKVGKPGEGKSLMDTTVLVENGTYAVVRHPQLLGGMLLIVASMLISQHWLSALVGVPIIVWGYSFMLKEEQDLLVKFGDDYQRYMQKVPRLNFLLGVVRLVRRK